MKRRPYKDRLRIYTLHIDGQPTGYGATMTRNEARHTNEMLRRLEGDGVPAREWIERKADSLSAKNTKEKAA